MKTLIAYDTRYGTTTTIAHWLCEGIAGDCDISNVADVASLDYDLIVIGSPIYTDEPLPSVMQFLHDHQEALSQKKVALFFVYDELLTLKSTTYVEELREQAPPGVLAVGIFGGYFDMSALNEYDRQTMDDFFERLGKRYEVLDHRNKDDVVRFGKLLREKLTEARRSTIQDASQGQESVTNDSVGWYSVSVEYRPIPSELRPGRGEWYLQAILIHEYRDPSGRIQSEKTPLGNIDVDHIDSVELRKAFYVATDEALNALQLPHETREQIAAELRLVVRPPTEDTTKRPRIGLGALLPDEK